MSKLSGKIVKIVKIAQYCQNCSDLIKIKQNQDCQDCQDDQYLTIFCNFLPGPCCQSQELGDNFINTPKFCQIMIKITFFLIPKLHEKILKVLKKTIFIPSN